MRLPGRARAPDARALEKKSPNDGFRWEARIGELAVAVGFRTMTLAPPDAPSRAVDVWEWEGGRTV